MKTKDYCVTCGADLPPNHTLKLKKLPSFSVEGFETIVDQMKEIHRTKSHDYAGDDYLSDLRASNRMAIPSWKNAALRIQQKMSRLESFCRQEELLVKDESIEDTLKDMAVYSILCLMLFRNKK